MTTSLIAELSPTLIGITAILVIWFFALGAAMGSFLNVVAWRLPRQKTLMGSSACPSCKRRIRLRDNIPVFSYFALKGKCRNCEFSIPRRYVIIEIIAGFCAVALFGLELALRGANIPGWSIDSRLFIDELLENHGPVKNLIGFFLQHGILIILLLITLLIKSQQDRIPTGLILMGWMISLILVIGIDTTMPIGIKGEVLGITQHNYSTLLIPIVGAIAGIAIGLVSGILFGSISRNYKWDHQLEELAMVYSLIGIYLGWQATVVIAVTTLMVMSIILLRATRRSTTVDLGTQCTILIAGVTTMFICTWSVWM